MIRFGPLWFQKPPYNGQPVPQPTRPPQPIQPTQQAQPQQKSDTGAILLAGLFGYALGGGFHFFDGLTRGTPL